MHKLRKLIALLGVVAISSTLVVSTATAAEWYEPYMQDLVDVGVDFGAPGSNATRCEWTQGVVAWNGLEADAPAEPTFLDVPRTHDCFEAVEAAYAHGVVSGYSNSEGEPTGYFGPADSVTREQAAKLTVEGEDLPVIEDSGIFPDGSSFSSWATDAWYPSTVYAWNKMVGDSDTGMFRPGDNINHAEAAKVITIPAELNAAYVEGEEPDEVVSEGDLLVELSDDTPVGDTVPCRSTSVEVAKWDFTAQDGDVILDLVRVHTHGVTSLQSGHALYLYDGADRLTSGKSVNSSTNLINFTNLNLTIDDGETVTLTLKIDISASTTTCVSAEMGFEIAEVAHIDASDAEVAGDFPLQSDTFGISTTNAGILTIEKNGTIANAKVGEDDVVVAKFKMSAATEAAEIEQLGLLITGTISNDAIENMELYVSGETDPLATTASLNSKDLAVFVLDTPYVITKGDTKAFTMKADFNTGRSADTVLIYVDETTDVLSIGATYGFGMAVDINNSSGYDGTTGGACSSATNDTCSYSALEGGDVTISSSGPTASDIGTAADDVHLLDFSIVSVSDITFKNFPISLNASEDATDTTEGLLNSATSAANFTDIKVINVDTGETLMGPIDSDVMVTATNGSTAIAEGTDQNQAFYRFSDEFDMEIGEELNLAITCDVANTATLDGMTLVATLDLGATYPQIKDINNKTVTNATSLVPASTITGKTMTVATPSLELALAAVPVSTTHIKGEAGVKFTGISAKCGAASACKITDVLLQGYIDDDDADLWSITGTAASHSTVINEIVGSVWLEDSAGGVVAAAQSVESDGDAAFNNMTWVLDAGETTIFYIVGNISSDAYKDTNPEHIAFGVATAGDVDYEDDDGNTRDSTGTPNSEGTGATTPSTYVSISEGGSLTIAVDASTPKEDIVVAGSTDVAISEFKFTTTDEAFIVRKLSVNARQANAGTVADIDNADLGAYDNNVSSITISYLNSDGDTETKEGFLTNGTATFGGMDFYIEKDDDATLTVYADVNSISGQAQVGEFVDLNLAFNDFEAIAQSSGETYKADKIDAGVAAASDLDFGTISWIDSALAIDTDDTGDKDGPTTLGTSGDFTVEITGGGAAVDKLPVGTLICIDGGDDAPDASCDTTDDILVVTAWADGTNHDTVTVTLIDDADTGSGDYDDDDVLYYALPGGGYLTGSNHMHVYEAKPEISLSASSPSGSRSVGAADNAFVFDIEETGGLDKVQIRAANELTTVAAGYDAGTDGNPTVANNVETDGDELDGTSSSVLLVSATAGDSVSFDAGTVGTSATDLGDLASYSRINFWIQDDAVSGAVAQFADLKICTHTSTASDSDPGGQCTALSQTACGAAAATFVDATAWYNCDLALHANTDYADEFIHLEFHSVARVANDDLFYIDRVLLYNDKLTVDIATDTDLDTYANNTSKAGSPSEVLLKEGGSTVAQAYWDTLTNGASATTTAKAVFIPTTAIEVSKGTTKTFTVQADTSDLIAEDSGEADPVTFSIDLGTAVAGAVTAGDIWWNETNFANATAGGAPGTSYALTTPGIIKWLGQVTNTTLSSNTVNY